MVRHAATRAAPWYYSATQLKRADLCIRAWAWEKICGFVEPPGAAAVFGSNVHTVLQKWLSEGHAPDQFKPTGQVAFAGIPWLPPPGPELEVEREFRIKVGDFHYRGFVDLGFMNSDGVPWVVDHKTTRDFMWCLSIDDLMHDVQALLYAKEAIDRYEVDKVHLRWVYYLTTSPYRSRITEVTMSREEIDNRWPVIDELARETDRVRLTVLNPLDLPPNANACAAYGGCPHQQRCNLTPREKRHSIMAQQDKKALLARMRDRAQNRAGSSPKAEPVSSPASNKNGASRPDISVVPDPTPAKVKKTEAEPDNELDAEERELQEKMERLAAKKAAMKAKAEAARAAKERPPMNPPEQPPREVQLSSDMNETVEGREETTTKKPRASKTKETGFVISDVRTARVLVVVAAVLKGDFTVENGWATIDDIFE